MASTAVATTNKTTAVKYNPAAFAFAKMGAAANAASVAMDGKELKEGSGTSFPGMKHQWNGKTNVWSTYDFTQKNKDDRTTELDDGFKVVLNYQHVQLVWRKMEDNGKGGKKVIFKHLTPLLDADTLPKREDLGDTDQDDWEVSADGNALDPWKMLLVAPIREEGSDTIDHIELGTKTANKEFFYLYSKLAADAMMHMGELPVVEVSTKVDEFDVDAKDKLGNVIMDKKTNKPKRAKIQLPKPSFKVVGWTEMVECDFPKDAEAVSELTSDVGEVESTKRTSPSPATEDREASAKQAKAAVAVEAKVKGGKRKVVAASADDI